MIPLLNYDPIATKRKMFKSIEKLGLKYNQQFCPCSNDLDFGF